MNYPRFKKEPLADNFVHLVDVVFGVLLAQGLLLYKENLLNFFSIENLPNSVLLLAVYMIILFSWYGYHKSVLRYPYNQTIWSRLRLVLDLLILVTYAYILYGLFDPFKLLIGSAAVFILYFFTGLVRIKEWNDSKVSKWYLHVIFAFLFLLCYYISYYILQGAMNEYTLKLFIAIFTISLTLGYRFTRFKKGYPPLIFVGVDIDGVLGEQVPHVLKWLREKKGINHNKRKEDIKSWTEPITSEITIDTAIEDALLNEEFVEEMPVVLGSTKAMEEMYDKYHIVIASARPSEAEEATKRWLRKHFKYHEYVNTREIGKHQLGLDILIDDNLENIKKFCQSGGRFAVIFNQPWNQSIDNEIRRLMNEGKVVRCNTWEEVIRNISGYIEKAYL